jgi:hypothetical protein
MDKNEEAGREVRLSGEYRSRTDDLLHAMRFDPHGFLFQIRCFIFVKPLAIRVSEDIVFHPDVK